MVVLVIIRGIVLMGNDDKLTKVLDLRCVEAFLKTKNHTISAFIDNPILIKKGIVICGTIELWGTPKSLEQKNCARTGRGDSRLNRF